VFKAVEDRST